MFFSETYGVQDIRYYDGATSGKTSNYTIPSNCSMTYSDGKYTISSTQGDRFINIMNGIDNVRFEVLMTCYPEGAGITVSDRLSFYNNFRVTGRDGGSDHISDSFDTTEHINNSWSRFGSYVNATIGQNDYFRLILEVTSSTITASVEKEDGTVIMQPRTKSRSITPKYLTLFDNNYGTWYVKEIKVTDL